ncbi:MAG: hypothetical protein ACPL6F_00580 [Anaerolineales bacterium]
MHRKENSGFFSIDALLALTLLLVITTSLLHLYEDRRKSAEALGTGLEAKMIGNRLASAINAVYVNGPNFRVEIKLPENVEDHKYRIFSDNSVGLLTVEISSGETVETKIACRNFKNFVLEFENLGKKIEIFWEESQICVVSQ